MKENFNLFKEPETLEKLQKFFSIKEEKNKKSI